MRKHVAFCSFLLPVIICVSPLAGAHLLDVEEQIIVRTGDYNEHGQEILESEPKPWQRTDADSSWAQPHDIKFPLLDSQAIFSWLDPDDVDIYRFTVTYNDVAHGAALGFGGAFVIAAPIPPACNQTKTHYPAIALVAPFGTAPVQDPAWFDLPFEVPPGHGVLPVYNTRAQGNEQRPIFVLPPEDTAIPLNLSWFLPNGCVTEPYFNCTNSDTLGAPIFFPGATAYLAVWSPAGNPMDYTLNLGVDENNFQSFENIEDLVRDNNHLHTPCTDPYP